MVKLTVSQPLNNTNVAKRLDRIDYIGLDKD